MFDLRRRLTATNTAIFFHYLFPNHLLLSNTMDALPFNYKMSAFCSTRNANEYTKSKSNPTQRQSSAQFFSPLAVIVRIRTKFPSRFYSCKIGKMLLHSVAMACDLSPCCKVFPKVQIRDQTLYPVSILKARYKSECSSGERLRGKRLFTSFAKRHQQYELRSLLPFWQQTRDISQYQY